MAESSPGLAVQFTDQEARWLATVASLHALRSGRAPEQFESLEAWSSFIDLEAVALAKRAVLDRFQSLVDDRPAPAGVRRTDLRSVEGVRRQVPKAVYPTAGDDPAVQELLARSEA